MNFKNIGQYKVASKHALFVWLTKFFANGGKKKKENLTDKSRPRTKFPHEKKELYFKNFSCTEPSSTDIMFSLF